MSGRWRPFRGRISGVTLLAAAVLVLLPALAWLQYSWLDQIAEADRERRERTLQTAASQLAQDFESELAKTVSGLQIEPGTVEQQAWSSYAGKYQAWTESAMAPDIVKAIYFVEGAEEGSKPAAPVLRAWNPKTRTFEVADWPEQLQGIRMRFTPNNRRIEIQAPGAPPRGRGFGGFDRLVVPPTPLGDEQAIVMPVMRLSPLPPLDAGGPPPPPDVRLLGFTIVSLNLTALADDLLPVLIRRHMFDDRGHTDYLLAVVSRDDASRVMYESSPGAAQTALARPDASTTLLGSRVGFMFMGRDGRRRPDPREPHDGGGPGPAAGPVTESVVVNVLEARRPGGGAVQTRILNGDGHWRLVATHRAGSLEAAVAAARTRNFALSSGILALLAAAIGLIVVSARRADRLARQQLEFVAAVSHELRTPVSVIGAAAGNLADGVVDEPSRVKKYGATIQAEARRLTETVERVLQLAGIAAGRAAAARAPLAVSTLIEEAVAACRHEIESAGVTVDMQVAPELLAERTRPGGARRIDGDAAALRSAIQNLIGNAIKYGGDARWVRVSAAAAGTHAVRIAVEDRGVGIDADDRQHIFEPFYRGREAVSRQIHGSGLGLHLVRRIVESHGGHVSVESEPGRGSTFTIELPTVHHVLVRRAGVHDQSPADVVAGV